MILADHGATVTKVEPPQGDETRDWGPPFLDRGEGARDASYFLGVNRNKSGISLDLAKPEGRAVLLRLLEGADVLIENFKPGGMEAWGLGYDALAPQFPRLIHARISGFGADGPLGGLPGYDAVVQAMTGLMTINGSEGTGPLRMGTPLVDMGTGLYAATAILMALYERQRSGQGQFIDMTLHDVGLTLLHSASANYLLSGVPPRRHGNAHPNIAPYDIFPTASGPIFIAGGNDGQFRKLLTLLGRGDLIEDARFATNADRVAHRAVLNGLITEALAAEDGEAIALRLIEAGVPAGPVRPVDEALSSPHAAHREMVVEQDGIRMVGTPIKFSRTPGGVASAPPRFGQDTKAVLEAHGFDADEIAALIEAGAIRTTRRK